MKLETGYVYHIKNEFFEFAQDNKLMKNHEGNATRPNYLCIKKDDSNLLWFIPMSSKVDKYNKIMQQKIKKMVCVIPLLLANIEIGRQHF